ncbi:MAG: hypothetical protein M3Y80_06495 [Verrucomicrobiota bacterium]|nr:hypothetical protein [Verrucomicrobiota bacterium]
MNNELSDSELSSLEGTRGQFNVRSSAIKLGIAVHQAFYVVVAQEGGTQPKPAQRFGRWPPQRKAPHAAGPFLFQRSH